MPYKLRIDVLKEIAREKNLSVEELAEIFCVKKDTMRRYLRGKRSPDLVRISIACCRFRLLIGDLAVYEGKDEGAAQGERSVL